MARESKREQGEKRFTLAQMRSAFIAGTHQNQASRPTKVAGRTRRAMDFMESELLRMADTYGPARAFSRQREANQWTHCLILNLFSEGGGVPEAYEVFGRVIGNLTDKHGGTAEVSHADDCLERRLYESLERMAARVRDGSRPSMTIAIS